MSCTSLMFYGFQMAVEYKEVSLFYLVHIFYVLKFIFICYYTDIVFLIYISKLKPSNQFLLFSVLSWLKIGIAGKNWNLSEVSCETG